MKIKIEYEYELGKLTAPDFLYAVKAGNKDDEKIDIAYIPEEDLHRVIDEYRDSLISKARARRIEKGLDRQPAQPSRFIDVKEARAPVAINEKEAF